MEDPYYARYPVDGHYHVIKNGCESTSSEFNFTQCSFYQLPATGSTRRQHEEGVSILRYHPPFNSRLCKSFG